jgi:hypothetical protein
VSEHLSPVELEEAAAGLPMVAGAHLEGCAQCKARVDELVALSDGLRVQVQFKARLASVLQQAAEKPIARMDPETGELTISQKKAQEEAGRSAAVPLWKYLMPALALAASVLAFIFWPPPQAGDDLRLKGAATLRVVGVDGRDIEKAKPGQTVELAVGAAGHPQGLVVAVDASGEIDVLWPRGATLSSKVPAGAGAHLEPAFEVTPGSMKLFAFFASGPFDANVAQARVQAAVDKAKAEGKSPLQAEVQAGETGSVASVLLKVEP